MGNTTLLTYVALLSGVLVTAWLLAVRAGADWLRPGHGPLWYAAGALTFALGSTLAALQTTKIITEQALFRFGGTFQAVVLALIAVIALFPALGLAFKLLYTPGPREPPCPPLFISFGIAPDGSPLLGLRSMLRSLAIVGLLIALLLILGMDVAPIAGGRPHQHTLWAFGFAALLAVLFGSTHPVRPIPPPARSPPKDLPLPTKPFADRIDALHRWLGSPQQAEYLPPVARDRKGGKQSEKRFGVDLYPYQLRLLDDWADVPALALAGPIGTGRTTAALLRAIDLALSTGASCAVVTPSRADVAQTWQRARALTEKLAAGAAVSIDDGLPPRPADIWVVALDDLERFLDDTVDPGAHPLVQRLRLVVLDDVDQLFGPAVARARFLVYRLAALRQGHPPQLLLAGNLSPQVLQTVADRIATANVKVVPTSGEHDPQGASSRAVRRFVVDQARIDHKSTATFGLLGIANGYARIVTEVDDPSERLQAELEGEPWAPWPPPHERDAKLPAEVLLARIGARSAWQVLGHRRYYVEGETPAHEYLLFGDDAMSQLLLRQYRKANSWWPAWYDTARFPRLLSAVPSGQTSPLGLQAQARAHMRAALDKSFVEVARLEQVFSPDVARQVLSALENTRIFESFEGWRPNRGDAKKPTIVRLCRAQGAVEADRERSTDKAELIAHSVGLSWKVPSALLDFDYYTNAIVTLDGKRYKVQPGRQAGPLQRQRNLEAEPSAATSRPIRAIRFARHGNAPLDIRKPRYGGREGLQTIRCTVQLHLTHTGVHNFGYERDDLGAAQAQSADSLQRLYEEMLDAPVQLAGFSTRAWLVLLPEADEEVLHTLTHVLRDALDWFFVGASDFVGVSYELDFEGKAGIVFYDRHPEGLGCLDDIDDSKDLQAILRAAHEILAGCDCDSACAKCCRSTSCTQKPHNHKLDRKKAVKILDALFGRGARA